METWTPNHRGNQDASGELRRESAGSAPSPSCCTPSAGKRSIHQIMGGGKVADVILWRQTRVSLGVVVVATVLWGIVEFSGVSFLSIVSDVLLVFIAASFVLANGAGLLNKQIRPLPELVLSEEMVHNAAASVRVKINNVLLVAHDITLGKDFMLFSKMVICLWLLSIVGSFFTFFTISYIVLLLAVTIPALYAKYEDHVDKYAGIVHQEISKHYKLVDESVISRLPRSFSKKDA